MKLVWQFVEGRLLLLQVAIMLGFAVLGFWLWCSTVCLYATTDSESPRCLTGLGGVLLMILLAEMYYSFLALWQWMLLRRRRQGSVGWAGTSWILLFLGLVPVWLAWSIWLGM